MADVELTDCPFDSEPTVLVAIEPNELDQRDHDPFGFWSTETADSEGRGDPAFAAPPCGHQTCVGGPRLR